MPLPLFLSTVIRRSLLDKLPDNLTCWIMSDGKPGMENQCLGLAEALGLDPVVKRLTIRQPWRSLPPQLWLTPCPHLLHRLTR